MRQTQLKTTCVSFCCHGLRNVSLLLAIAFYAPMLMLENHSQRQNLSLTMHIGCYVSAHLSSSSSTSTSLVIAAKSLGRHAMMHFITEKQYWGNRHPDIH